MSEVYLSLDGRAALITGGSKGIDRSIALAFAEHGANVAIVARGRDALGATWRDIEAAGANACRLVPTWHARRICMASSMRPYPAFGAVDIPVYGAATAEDLAPIIKSTSEGWDR